MFACEHYGLQPDIMTGGKGLSGGVGSLGVTCASNTVCNEFFGGTTPTSGGNAISAAVSLRHAANSSVPTISRGPTGLNQDPPGLDRPEHSRLEVSDSHGRPVYGPSPDH